MDRELLWGLLNLAAFVLFWDFMETFRIHQGDARNRALQAIGLRFFPTLLASALTTTREMNTVRGVEGIAARAKAVLDGSSAGAFEEELNGQLPNALVGVSQFEGLGNTVRASAEVFRDRHGVVLAFDEFLRIGQAVWTLLLLSVVLVAVSWAIPIIPADGNEVVEKVLVFFQQATAALSIFCSLFAGVGLVLSLKHRHEFMKGCAKHHVTVAKAVFDFGLVVDWFKVKARSTSNKEPPSETASRADPPA